MLARAAARGGRRVFGFAHCFVDLRRVLLVAVVLVLRRGLG